MLRQDRHGAEHQRRRGRRGEQRGRHTRRGEPRRAARGGLRDGDARDLRGQAGGHGARARGRERDPERGDARRDAAADEDGVELLERAVHALAGGLLGDLQRGADLGKGPLFKKTQDNGLPLVALEFDNGVVEQGPEACQVGVSLVGGVGELHGLGGGFARLAALLAADDLGGRELGAEVEPAGERGPVAQGRRLAGEGDEDGLRHIVGKVGVAADAAPGGGVDQPDVALHELREGVPGAGCDVMAEKFGVVVHGDYNLRLPLNRKADNLSWTGGAPTPTGFGVTRTCIAVGRWAH